MNRTMPLWKCCAGVLAALAVLAVVPAARAQGNATALRAGFDRADLNADSFLDGEELAKRFRGPTAKVPPPIYDDQGRPTAVLTQARQKYPDLVFLWAADTDGDQRVSWKEYQTYSRKHGAPFGPGQAVNLQPLLAAFPQGLGNQLSRQRQATPYVYSRNRRYMRGHHSPRSGSHHAAYYPSTNSYLRYRQAAARNYQQAVQAYARNYQRSVQAVMRNRQRAVQAYVRNYQQALRADQALRQRRMSYLRSHWRRR